MWHDNLSTRELLVRVVELLTEADTGAIVAAIDNLNAAVTENTTQVNDLITAVQADSQDTAIQAAADQLAKNNAAAATALTPPPADTTPPADSSLPPTA